MKKIVSMLLILMLLVSSATALASVLRYEPCDTPGCTGKIVFKGTEPQGCSADSKASCPDGHNNSTQYKCTEVDIWECTSCDAFHTLRRTYNRCGKCNKIYNIKETGWQG